jgi:hypothetical protein
VQWRGNFSLQRHRTHLIGAAKGLGKGRQKVELSTDLIPMTRSSSPLQLSISMVVLRNRGISGGSVIG